MKRNYRFPRAWIWGSKIRFCLKYYFQSQWVIPFPERWWTFSRQKVCRFCQYIGSYFKDPHQKWIILKEWIIEIILKIHIIMHYVGVWRFLGSVSVMWTGLKSLWGFNSAFFCQVFCYPKMRGRTSIRITANRGFLLLGDFLLSNLQHTPVISCDFFTLLFLLFPHIHVVNYCTVFWIILLKSLYMSVYHNGNKGKRCSWMMNKFFSKLLDLCYPDNSSCRSHSLREKDEAANSYFIVLWKQSYPDIHLTVDYSSFTVCQKISYPCLFKLITHQVVTPTGGLWNHNKMKTSWRGYLQTCM